MIYEWRTYEAVPGKMDAVHRRFADHTVALFARHGVHVLGFFQQEDDPNRMHYLCAFPDEASRERAEAAFGSDPEWQRVKAESEAAGPIVAKRSVVRLRGTSYSPLQ